MYCYRLGANLAFGLWSNGSASADECGIVCVYSVQDKTHSTGYSQHGSTCWL